MKRCAVNETQLNDHLDKLLSPDESRFVERHLAECSECRRYFDDLVALRGMAAELPRAIEPVGDLWPRILSQLPPRPTGVSRRQRVFRIFLAAAACLLVAVGLYRVVVTSSHNVPGSNTEVAFQSGPSMDDQMRVEIAKAEDAYLEAANGFLNELNGRESTLAPEALRAIEGSLAVTDRAIAEVKGALKEQPGNFELARKLLATHELRVELLQQTMQFSTALRNGG